MPPSLFLSLILSWGNTDSAYKYELARGPRAWLANQYLNNVFYKEKEVGGHFAAW